MFKGNKIYKIDKNGHKKQVLFIPGLKVRFKGKNSVVTVHEPMPRFNSCSVKLGNNSSFEIGSSKFTVKKLQVFVNGNNCHCLVGKDLHLTNHCEVHVGPDDNLKVEIGDNCMFGREILIRATDGHAIFDSVTGKVINNGQNVKIGNHVWLAEGVSVLKGCNIADNCVVGLKSIVTKDCETSHSVYAGVPAKLVKSGINWTAEPPSKIKNTD